MSWMGLTTITVVVYIAKAAELRAQLDAELEQNNKKKQRKSRNKRRK